MLFTRSAKASRTAGSLVVAAVGLATVAAAVLPFSPASASTRAARRAERQVAPTVVSPSVLTAARFASMASALHHAQAGASKAAVNVATGSISGTVTNGGSGLAGICVDVIPMGSENGGFTSSGSGGAYTVTGLAAGTYVVYFYAGCGSASQNWVPQYWKDALNYEDATPLTVAAGKKLSGINAAMQVGATISGTVTASGSPVDDVCVTVYGVTVEFEAGATTSGTGAYSADQIPTGAYDVEFAPCEQNQNYLSQWWKNASSQSTATAITLAAGQSVTGIDASLKTGGTISGTVRSKTGPLADICVDVSGVNVPSPGSFGATTASNGTYAIVGLPTGSYLVEFQPCTSSQNWLVQYWKGSATADEATVVSVTAGDVTSGVNPTMEPGGTVTGTVKSRSGAPLEGICVDVTTAADTGGGSGASTGSNGKFSVTGLPSGTYVAEFTIGCGAPSDNWITQYSGGAASLATAKTIVVRAGASTGGVNASLAPGGEITGTVTGHGAKLAEMCVESYSNDEEEATTYTANNGSYTLEGLASGSYDVEFTAGCGGTSTDWAPQWYRAASSQASATSVRVTAGKTTSGINAAMAVGGTIDGTVTIAGGGAVVEGCVEAYPVVPGFASASAYTAANGSYSIPALTPGKYVVGFDPSCGSSNALSDYYKGAASPKAATQVNVVAGKVAVVNTGLAKGGEISGTVTGPTKAPLADVCVDLFSTSDRLRVVGYAETALNGSYAMVGLPTGHYLAEFSDCSGYPMHASQWYRGRGTEASATQIAVTAGKTVTGIDAQLSDGGTVTGTVKRPGGIGEPDVCVFAISTTNGNGGAYTTTTGNGSYSLYGLEPGKYDIEFEPACIGNTFATIWYKSGLYQSKSTAVTVSSGHTTTGVSANLTPAGEISGTVKAGSTALAFACVTAYFAHTNVEANGTDSYADGTYVIEGLAPGAYDVEFQPSCGTSSNVAPQWWKKATSEAKAATVTVKSGKNTGGIDAALGAGGQITGTVKNSAGSGLENVEVEAIPRGSTEAVYFAYANPRGNYTLTGLLAGSYTVVFNPSSICGGSGSIYAQQYWKDTASESAAKAVKVTVGKTTTGINASLVLSSTSSGYQPDC